MVLFSVLGGHLRSHIFSFCSILGKLFPLLERSRTDIYARTWESHALVSVEGNFKTLKMIQLNTYIAFSVCQAQF